MKTLKIIILLAIIAPYTALAAPLNGQQIPSDPKALTETILHMDGVMFDAFNSRDLEAIKNVFAVNSEFYHDRDGVSDYETTISSFKKLFGSNTNLKRELIPESVKVYPIPGFGAVEIGDHKFVSVDNGKTYTAVFHFIHTWQFKDGQWRVTRAISVGH